MRFWRELKPAAFAAAPSTAAILALLAGIMLLASGATPTIPDRFFQIYEISPVVLIEVSHFLSSILGLVLVLLAFGPRARLDGAWWATLVTLIVASPLALLKAFAWEEALALALFAALLLPFHGAFPRKARLLSMEVTPGWLISAFAVMVGAGLLADGGEVAVAPLQAEGGSAPRRGRIGAHRDWL